MTLARSWSRQLVRASGAAVLVPVSVVAALAVLVLSGGLGGLNVLGQVLTGPSAPPLPLAGAPAAARSRSEARSARVASVALRARSAAITAGSGASVSPRRAAVPLSAASHGRLPAAAGRPAGGAHRHLPPAKSGGTTPAPPAAGSAPAPTALGTVVNAGVGLAQQLPAPLGVVATQTLQSVGSVLGRVLAPGTRR